MKLILSLLLVKSPLIQKKHSLYVFPLMSLKIGDYSDSSWGIAESSEDDESDVSWETEEEEEQKEDGEDSMAER